MRPTWDSRLTFSATIWVRAEPARLFALVSDPRRKDPLNPSIQAIRVELEGEEPPREGSWFYHRLRKGTKTLEYRSRCVRMVPPTLFEARAETDPPFQVRVTLEPVSGGCRLTQQESVEWAPVLPDAVKPVPVGQRSFADMVDLLILFPPGRHLASELRAYQRERLARRLTRELQAWLEAIKAHVESQGTPGGKDETARAQVA